MATSTHEWSDLETIASHGTDEIAGSEPVHGYGRLRKYIVLRAKGMNSEQQWFALIFPFATN